MEKDIVILVVHTRNEHRVSELIPVLGSQPADDRSHKPGGRLPLLSARPAVTCPAAEHHRPLADTKLYCLVTGILITPKNISACYVHLCIRYCGIML